MFLKLTINFATALENLQKGRCALAQYLAHTTCGSPLATQLSSCECPTDSIFKDTLGKDYEMDW